MGAWIETIGPNSTDFASQVAPRVGAWIETSIVESSPRLDTVAPRVGAWIETLLLLLFRLLVRSHPVWVRGLKPQSVVKSSRAFWSHPVWVRGLKPREKMPMKLLTMVAPRVGAWIETYQSKLSLQ